MKGKLYQVVTALACGLSTTCFGLMFVWPSYTLPMLASNNTILSAPLTAGNEAMLGSLPSLGGIIGTMLVGTLIDSMGRKWSSITGSVIMMISWCIVAFTNSITVVLVARFLGGVSCGLALVITPIYISEIAEDRVRGILSSVMVLLYSLGLLISYFIGWYFSYQAIAWINFAFSAARGLMLLFVPESPVYLIKKRRVENARTAMSKFRGVLPTSLTVHQELCRIKRDLSSSLPLELVNGDGEEAEKKTLTTEEYKEEQNTTDEKFSALKILCKEPSSRRAFLIVIVTFSNEILMGIDSISVFANQVFHEADPSKADLCSVLLAVVWCCANLLSGILSDRIGRRPLLIGSSYLVAACLVTLGVLLQTRIAPAWVTATCIMLYCFFFMLGAGTVPYMLLSEVFNPKVQTLASMLITEWIWLVGFVILAVFNWLNRLIGIHATFYIFAFNALFNATFSYFLVPETKGLSNKEIQVALLKGRRK